MSKKMRLLLLSVAGALLLSGVPAVRAADLSVSPANNYIQIDGGEQQLLDFHLENREQRDAVVMLEARSFVPDDQYGQPLLRSELEFPYVNLSVAGEDVEQVVVPAASGLDIQVKVAPPLGLAVKEYPLTLLFTVQDDAAEVTGAQVGMQVGANLIVRLDTSNDDKSDLSLVIVKPITFLDTFASQAIQVKVFNVGPFGTLLRGSAQIARPGSSPVSAWEFYPDLILGESSRLARASDGRLDGNGNPTLSSDFVLPRWLLGHYQFEASVYSGMASGEAGLTTAIFDVYAFPYWLALLVVVIVLIAWAVRSATAKKSRRTRLEQRVAQMKRQKEFFE